MKKVLVFIALTAIVGSTASSQVGGRGLDQKSREALRELYEDVRDYAQANIIPKMREWKGVLDHSMSQEDLEALDALRDRAAQLRHKSQRLALALRKAIRTNNVGDERLFRAKIKELGKEREQLLKDLKPIGVANKATLVEIGKEAKPYGKVWKEGIKKVGLDWFQAHRADLNFGLVAALGKAMERLKQLGVTVDDATKVKLAAAMFMLWDGKDLPEMSQLLNDEEAGQDEDTGAVPEGYALEPNYPNPFNPSTKISFAIPKAEYVSLVVYDVLGKEVATLVDSELGAGPHSVVFDGKGLASGMYVYRLRAGGFVQERTMQLVK